ncbi:MAG: glucosamine-6-phosphate deaminase [Bacteroidetes bacterium]|nr:glucosamine-6-phosphate deaminase [Bacteroidota bacterium]
MALKATQSEKTMYERIPSVVVGSPSEGAIAVAHEIADIIKKRQEEGRNAVLGLATGSSPIKVYDELIRMHREEGLSFQNVVTFNLDEYFPMPADSVHSYVQFMNEQLFKHIDIKPENIHIPDGTLDQSEVFQFCSDYERKIDEAGGLDIQILGIGRTGHIGFNEPGSIRDSITRMVTLDIVTRRDASATFFGLNNVPRRAITMGVGTILRARRILLMAWGDSKAPIIQKTIEGPINDQIPATFLQEHKNTLFILDEGAASYLTRNKLPWLVGSHDWDDFNVRKAVVWLCQKVNKAVLKLTDEDYNENGLGELVTEHGPAYNINIKVFNQLQHTITGWPGGKPNADDSNRPERKAPFPKRAIIFSPHPDDDVISMGGTFIRLVDQGHEVHVAYQTSGNIAVFDEDALRFADFISDYAEIFNVKDEELQNLYDTFKSAVDDKSEAGVDSEAVRAIKGLIRRGEAKAGCRSVGIPDEQIHFLNLPFYETGKVKKNPVGPADIKIVEDIIRKVKPHQIYAAGDLADPHGTHKVCLEAIFAAVENLKHEDFMKDCWVWLYRGAWHEWDIEEIEMAVPISPEELIRKRTAIFKHQSQKDNVMFQGTDKREFWERAEDRNRNTARLYDQLGLAEYEAMEAFVRWHF